MHKQLCKLKNSKNIIKIKNLKIKIVYQVPSLYYRKNLLFIMPKFNQITNYNFKKFKKIYNIFPKQGI